MRFTHFNKTIRTVLSAVCIILIGASWAVAQQQVNLTAAPSSVTLPDGNSVPMWGYTCGGTVGDPGAGCLNDCPAADRSYGTAGLEAARQPPEGLGLTRRRRLRCSQRVQGTERRSDRCTPHEQKDGQEPDRWRQSRNRCTRGQRDHEHRDSPARHA